MVKRGTDDLKQLAITQSSLVRPLFCVLKPPLIDLCLVSSVPHRPSCTIAPRAISAPPFSPPKEDIARLPTLSRCVPERSETKRRASAECCTSCQADCGRTRRRYRGRVIWAHWPFWLPTFPTSTANAAANQVCLPFGSILGDGIRS